MQRLRNGENVFDALKRLGLKSSSPRSPPNDFVSKADRKAQIRSKLAGTVPTENRYSKLVHR